VEFCWELQDCIARPAVSESHLINWDLRYAREVALTHIFKPTPTNTPSGPPLAFAVLIVAWG